MTEEISYADIVFSNLPNQRLKKKIAEAKVLLDEIEDLTMQC